jgi:integrase
MAKSTTDRLQRRGNRWYLNLGIPRPLRQFFLSSTGKPLAQLQAPLGDLSFERAKIECSRRTTRALEVFAQLRAGVQMTPEEIKRALRVPDAERLERDAAVKKFQTYMRTAPYEVYGAAFSPAAVVPVQGAPVGETVSQAAEAWFAEMQRDKSVAVRKGTLEGHQQRVQSFIDQCGNLPLVSVTPAMASDFLDKVATERKLTNRTLNNYSMTMALIFKSARRRGRFEGDNPFEDQRRKVTDNKGEKFTVAELQAVFDALPREIKPAKHRTETALPWAAFISAFTGMRLEEICQLTVGDVKNLPANGGTLDCIIIHNGGNNHLKNDSSARVVPIHSQLANGGFLDYVRSLPQDGLLFPGLTRRASKDGKIGARVGELFRKKLVSLGIKRDGLYFHSFRHTVIKCLKDAGLRESDIKEVVGHANGDVTMGRYGSDKEVKLMQHGGPELKHRAAAVESIEYPGLNLPAAK